MPGPAAHVLTVVDGSADHRAAALAGADLLSNTPGLKVTVLAPAEVAQPTGAPRPSATGLVTVQRTTEALLETLNEIQERGVTTRLQTSEDPLLERAIDVARAHDLVVLPASMAEHAARFSTPVLLAP